MKRLRRLLIKLFAVLVLMVLFLTFLSVRISGSENALMQGVLRFGRTPKELEGPYRVTHVIDGDTFVADINDEETMIRLIGVDTPESVSKTSPEKNCEEGRIASDYTNALLSEKDIWIERDMQELDSYGRILGYVFLDSKGKDMLQDRLLNAGLADTCNSGGNIRYLFQFRIERAIAKRCGKGFWTNHLWDKGGEEGGSD